MTTTCLMYGQCSQCGGECGWKAGKRVQTVGYPQVYTLNGYQDAALNTLICPTERLTAYLPLQLASEAGEVAGKIAKSMRSGLPFDPKATGKELGDVLWCVAVLARHLGLKLEDVANENLTKLADRQARGVLEGNGDNR